MADWALACMSCLFPCPIGFSDHTTSVSAAVGAVALGASIIERHFTIDKDLDVPDAFFSADPKEMKTLVRSIRELEAALGTGVKCPTPTELDMRRETRKSAIARTYISKGEPITDDKFIIKRPGTGIAPKFANYIIGRKAAVDIEPDDTITWEKLS